MFFVSNYNFSISKIKKIVEHYKNDNLWKIFSKVENYKNLV